jgi:hypothetical protein
LWRLVTRMLVLGQPGGGERRGLGFGPMKRLTIDVPVSLHRRVRAACAKRGLKPSSVLRDLLEREFPETSRQFRLPL